MGYGMRVRSASFLIKRKDKRDALNAVKSLALKKNPHMWTGKSLGCYSWVDAEDYEDAKTLPEALSAWRWNALNGLDGDLSGIDFDGEKLGEDLILFNAIAPFVEPGSYIEMVGEDGDTWRWVFNGKTCAEIKPKVTW